MTKPSAPSPARGVAAAAAAFLLWGAFPLYWKPLAAVDARELIGHRIVWSMLVLLPLLPLTGGWGEWRRAWAQPRLILQHLLSGALLAANWLAYVWGVNTGRILETSLGYFLVPLLNATIGVSVLGERLRPVQIAALGLAGLGVGIQVVGYGQVPWIALTLAATWGVYSLLRKRSPLGSLAGLAVETALLTPAALAWLVWREAGHVAAFAHADATTNLLIAGTGVVTTIPLLLFAYGARLIRLTTVGLLQYLGPSLQFLIGVWVYHEQVGAERWGTFALIWFALALYSFDSMRALRAPATA